MTPDPSAVPDGWQVARLGDVAEVVMGQSPPGDTVLDWAGNPAGGDGLPFIQGNAEFGQKFPAPMKWCVRPAKVAKPRDLLISVRAPVGHTNRADRLLAIGRGLAAVRFTGADDAFGWHSVNHAKDVFERVAQGSTFEAIGGKELRSLTLLLPPLAEQRAIAAVLDAIDEAIERTEEVIAATERLRDALLHELLTCGLPGRHSEWADVPGLGTVPVCWDVVRLGEVTTDMAYGPRFPAGRYATDGGVVTLRTTDISDSGAIDWSQAPAADLEIERFAQFLLRRGDIVVTRSGSCGIAAIFRGHQKPVLPGAFLIRMRAARVEPEWVQLFLNSSIGRAQTLRAQAGGVQKNLNGPSLRALIVPMPPVGERQAILRVLSSVAETTSTTMEEARLLLSEKEALAEVLMTGRVRVPM